MNSQSKLRKRIYKGYGIEDCGDGWYVDKHNRIWHACADPETIEGAKLVLPDGKCCNCLKEAPPGVIFYTQVS